MEHNEEYEKHYSPDGERIEYLMEHPEENNQPIEEKWKEKFNNRFDIGPILLKSGGVRISALYGPEEIISFIENLLEQERKTYEAKKADYEFRSVGEWVDYHSRMGATIIVKNNLPIEARYENPVHSVIRAGLSLTSK